MDDEELIVFGSISEKSWRAESLLALPMETITAPNHWNQEVWVGETSLLALLGVRRIPLGVGRGWSV